MCEPVTLAAIGSTISGAVATATSAVASYGMLGATKLTTALKGLSAIQKAGAGLSILNGLNSHKMQAEAYEANANAAIQAQIDEQSLIRNRLNEEREKAATDKISKYLEGIKAESRARLASYESGAIQNQGAISQDITRQYLEANNMITQNVSRAETQANQQMKAATSTAQSRINSVAKPSRTATLLNIGAGAVTAIAS
ncbi:MAG: hypothetical protein Unbinned3329contig1000_26 [Prokaryotic dsDNA virus sp.]|jgi:hypothetical protein|nr:MAG: hypothetical protein Unbinned3329contig1000_26 [Prokaryotic dsDNA virus sp.]|tara:strand:- start:2672 stop:3268 length:597 start_codon:yes stop_codon:yes gene_type:complete